MATERTAVSKRSPHPVAVVLQVAIIVLLAVLVWPQLAPGIALESDSGYFGLVLSNGQIYYARAERKDSEVMLLSDAHYIKQITNRKTGQKSNQLTNRRKQAHGPEHMYKRQ